MSDGTDHSGEVVPVTGPTSAKASNAGFLAYLKTKRIKFASLDTRAKFNAQWEAYVTFNNKEIAEKDAKDANTKWTEADALKALDKQVGDLNQATTVPVAPDSLTAPSRKVVSTPENLAEGAKYSGAPTNRLLFYSGENLVDEKGNVVKGKVGYNDTAVNDSLAVFQEIKRDSNINMKEFLQTLKDKGFYGDGKPSGTALNGEAMHNVDEAAMGKFLQGATNARLTWRAYNPIMRAGVAVPDSGGGGSGGSFSAAADINADANRWAFKMLGRPLTRLETETAVRQIQQNQRAATSSPGGAQATSLDTATSQFVKGAAPEEAATYGLGKALDMIFKTYGGA